ncbi:hypothetical protein RIF29_16632 [Crotalaria pallida]|uniref:MADS-box domain-containing protein n=1 Tax=Crotalaria pallida TaxID=3830 RepID=A0AAN9IC80_CROPI
MASKTTTKPKAATSTRRKRKIEIKKVEQNNKRHVTFSKRKLGLFNKVTELSILCQAETALILCSQQGKLYACGYPGPDAVIHRFLNDGSPAQHGGRGGDDKNEEHQETVETLRLEYEALLKKLKEEKESLGKMQEEQKGSSDFPPWWNNDIEKMGLEDVEQFMASLDILKLNLVATAEAKKFNSMPQASMPMFPNLPLLNNNNNNNGCFNGGDKVWNLMNGSNSISRNTMVPNNFEFGHYYN